MKVLFCIFVITAIVILDFVSSEFEEDRAASSSVKPRPTKVWHSFWNPSICCNIENKYSKNDFHEGVIKVIDDCYQQFGIKVKSEYSKKGIQFFSNFRPTSVGRTS